LRTRRGLLKALGFLGLLPVTGTLHSHSFGLSEKPEELIAKPGELLAEIVHEDPSAAPMTLVSETYAVCGFDSEPRLVRRITTETWEDPPS